MDYSIKFNEAGIQYVVGLLVRQPINEAGPLFDDVRAQVQAQEAAAAAASRQKLVDEIRVELHDERARLVEAALEGGEPVP